MPRYRPALDVRDLWTTVKVLGHRSRRRASDPGEPVRIECDLCGIDFMPILKKIMDQNRLIAGDIPRCPGHRPLNYFTYRRPTVRELLEKLLKRKMDA